MVSDIKALNTSFKAKLLKCSQTGQLSLRSGTSVYSVLEEVLREAWELHQDVCFKKRQTTRVSIPSLCILSMQFTVADGSADLSHLLSQDGKIQAERLVLQDPHKSEDEKRKAQTRISHAEKQHREDKCAQWSDDVAKSYGTIEV
jgi:hypothetical protein